MNMTVRQHIHDAVTTLEAVAEMTQADTVAITLCLRPNEDQNTRQSVSVRLVRGATSVSGNGDTLEAALRQMESSAAKTADEQQIAKNVRGN